jgi:hypothetical protein
VNPKGTPENLTPFKPGDVGNPKGINQYTYRAEAEKALDAMLAEKVRGKTRSELIISRLLLDAKAGKPYALKLVLERILPAVTQHEVAVTEPAGADALLDRLAGIASKRRTNGSGAAVEPRRANGGNGAAS